MKSFFYNGFVFAFLVLVMCTGTWAQTGTTSIIGDVTDPQGRAVGGASVTAEDSLTGNSRTTQTNEAGFYQFLALQPSTYSLRVEAKGFSVSETQKVEALVSTTPRVDIKLQIGAVTDTVTVTEGGAVQVNTTDASIGNAFDSHQILALPFEGRDAAAILSLQPGIAFIGTNVDDNFDTRNGAVNGGRSDQANITLDGVDNNEQVRGTAFKGAVRTTLDSIEEFRVTTAGENADQGRSSGGQVTLVTKSGTNVFHGSLYEQHRPTNMVANDWFHKHEQLNAGQPNKPPFFLRNTFGGSIGGPIKKDRLFFFYNYEGLRRNESVNVDRTVPGLPLRDGVVFYPCPLLQNMQIDTVTCPGGTATGMSGKQYAFAPGTFGLGPAEIKKMDPNCAGIGSCPNGNGVDLAALALYNKYPVPIIGAGTCAGFDGFNTGCVSFSAGTPLRQNTNIAKIDYNLNQSGTHRLFLRGNYQTDSSSDVPEFPGGPPIHLLRNTSRALAAGYTAVFSANLVNSFRYGFVRQSQAQQGLQTQQFVNFRIFDDLNAETSTQSFHIPVHNWVDDLSWVKGKHTLQFGTNLRLINNVRASNATSFNFAQLNSSFLNTAPAGSGGSLDPAHFGFPAVDPNNTAVYDTSIVDLVGIVTEVTGNYNRTKTGSVLDQGTPVSRDFRAWESEWYVQDVWHVKPNLTVTAGLRYTLLEPPYETSGTQAAPNININSLVQQRAVAMAMGQTVSPTFSFDLSGQANGKKPYWPYDYKNFGPRLSIAYSPNPSGGLLRSVFGGGGKSSIRAGFGIVYDHFGQGIVDNFDQTGTFGLTTAISNTASIQTVDGGARFTGLNDIPTSSHDGVLLFPAPSGGFPATPPESQQISFGLDDKLKTPYSELVDFAVTRELPGGFVFEAAYVGRFAHRLLQQRDVAMPLNIKDPKSGVDYFTAATIFSKDFNNKVPVQNVQPIPYWENLFPTAAGVNGNVCGGNGAPGNASVANPTATQSMYELFYCNTGPGTFGESNALFTADVFCFPACSTINGQTQPFNYYLKQFSALYAWSSIGSSNYNAGEFSLRSKPKHGVQFDFNWTYSKSIDLGSDAERAPNFGGISAIVNTWNPGQFRAPSDFDIRHSLNSNWIAELPFGRGRHFGNGWNRFTDTLLGGWELSGVARWSSGLPFSISNGSAVNPGPFPTNFQLSGNAVAIGALPTTGVVPSGASGDPNVFLQGGAATAAFRNAYPGESGTRNNLRGPGFFGVDAGVNKTFAINERNSLRFSAYAFNLTNSVRFDVNSIRNNQPDQSTFGKFTGTLSTSRRLEFVLRYTF